MLEAITLIALFVVFLGARALLVARDYARKAAGSQARKPVVTPYVGPRYTPHGREIAIAPRAVINKWRAC
jgi:hypothetical protein